MRGIDYFGTLIMWLAVFIGWLIKGCKTNLFKECAKIEDSTKRNVGIIFAIFRVLRHTLFSDTTFVIRKNS